MVLKNDPNAYAIMGCAMRVHATLGFGFLESAYGDAMEIEFKQAGIPFVREDAVRIHYGEHVLPTIWRADFTCFDRKYIVELKAIKSITKIEWAQTIHYLRATRIPYALLINFGRPTLQYDTFDLDKLSASSVLGFDKTEATPHFENDTGETSGGWTAQSDGVAVAEPSLTIIGVSSTPSETPL